MALGAAVNNSEPKTNNNLDGAIDKVTKSKQGEAKIAGQWVNFEKTGAVFTNAGRRYDTVT